jgi:hypothetical protein
MLCFRPCDARLELPINPEEVARLKDHKLPPYPTTDDEVLSQWEELNEYYHKVLSAGLRRSGECKDSKIIYHF